MNLSPALIAMFVVSGASGSSAAAALAGCGSKHASGLQMTHIDSMPIKTPLYVLHKAGQLFKVDPGKKKWERISDHGIGHSKVVVSSPDRRWIVYGGVLKHEDRTRYWVYDPRTGTDRLILDYPAWGGRVPDFSPDSSYLALAASYGSGPSDDARPPLILMSTANWLPVPITLPVRTGAEDYWTSTQWSQDATELLVMLREGRGVGSERYYSYRVADRRLETVAGKNGNDQMVERGGRPVRAFDALTMRSVLASKPAYSPDGQRHAFRGAMNSSGTWPLHLKGADGAVSIFAQGGFSHCPGLSLEITGWLDNRHLVYQNSSSQSFVFDTSTGRTAVLFDGQATIHNFTW